MSDIAIKVENLSKRYRIGLKESQSETFAEALTRWLKSPFQNLHNLHKLSHFSKNGHDADDTIWALKDVSFEVKYGEVVGIIGHNGAGKSTLLKILSRITEPSDGRAIINGRVASLLEVGTGFHSDLTGRENVYLNGTVLGMRKQEIDRKFDEIVDFSGVEKFIDTPVKRYSSGMKVRLAFAVAAHLEPEILLIDEVLAVGDAEFQGKCLGKIGDIAQHGRTILFVSHDMPAVSALCQRTLLIGAGQIVKNGNSDDVITAYLHQSKSSQIDFSSENTERTGNGSIKFTGWSLVDEVMGESRTARANQPCAFKLSYTTELDKTDIRNAEFAVLVKSRLGHPLFTVSTTFVNAKFPKLPCSGTVSCYIDRLPLTPDMYEVHLWCATNGKETADRIENAGHFDVVATDVFGSGRLPKKKHGPIIVKQVWETSS